MNDLQYGKVLDLDMNNLSDYSGNSNNGTASGTSLTTDVYGRKDRARSFDGVDDYVESSINMFDLDDEYHTISLWFYNDSSATDYDMLFMGKYYSGKDHIELRTEDNGTTPHTLDLSDLYRIGGSWYGTADNYSYDYDKWYHLVIVKNETTGYVYINGLLYESFTLPQTMSNINNPTNLYLGEHSNGVHYFKGSIYKPQIWNRALNSEEVKQLYNEVKNNYQGLFDGLAAGYDFKKDAKDFSGNGNDGTVTGATLTTDQFGIADSAYSFDGVDDYVYSASVFPLGTKTFSLWIKTDYSGSDSKIILDSRVSGYNQFYIAMQPTSKNLRVFHCNCSATSIYSTTEDLNDGKWHLITITYISSSSLKLYIDGVLDAEITSGIGDLSSSGVNLNLGRRYTSGTANFWDGKIAMPLIFNRVMSASEVKTLYDLTSKGMIYPYNKNSVGGITQ